MKLASFLPYRFSVLTHNISQSIASIYSSRFHISAQEWRIIANLGNGPPLSANEIGSHVNLDKVQMSRALTKLINKGLVLRTLDKLDKRKSSLKLSRKGLQLYEKIVPIALERERQLIAVLNRQERAQLDAILEKLERRAEALNTLKVD
ncbi:MarR family transcriptional regulator [Sedimenticola selenatireducens]|uniref:MarR family winged helix-turn-helix transcriptional regulator n=1 Tax=Sedimenticola selenatireducens TaxID=191960 RepID=UPI002AAC3F6A|nr:MarR family transcriptional regulator [Sedimenticola selenatireducens]